VAAVNRNQLDAWLARLGGPGFVGFENRDAAVAEMRAAGADALFPLLIPMLAGDAEARCTACEAILRVDAERGVELVLPCLSDPDVVVRWFACECIAGMGGKRAIPALLSALRSDEDAQVRGTAARGLGWQGGPEVIPALLSAMASDHETDIHGHSPSHCASMALDDVLGSDETCLHFGNVCRMLDREPDLDRLRRLAEERYLLWQCQAERGAAPDPAGGS
jgi:HEAT repeat protein